MILLSCMLCTTPEAFKILDVQALTNNVIQSQCFAEAMLSQGIPYVWVDRLQSANRKLPIYFYRQNNNVVGYMNPGSDNIYLNRKFHDGYSLCTTGSNITHELTHVLGFRHKRDVAYAANYAFEACCVE